MYKTEIIYIFCVSIEEMLHLDVLFCVSSRLLKQWCYTDSLSLPTEEVYLPIRMPKAKIKTMFFPES